MILTWNFTYHFTDDPYDAEGDEFAYEAEGDEFTYEAEAETIDIIYMLRGLTRQSIMEDGKVGTKFDTKCSENEILAALSLVEDLISSDSDIEYRLCEYLEDDARDYFKAAAEEEWRRQK